MTRHLADMGPWRVLKSGHVTITKTENPLIPKMLFFCNAISFRSMTKNNEVIAEKPFKKSGVTRCLAVLN